MVNYSALQFEAMALGDMSAISPYKIMNYQPKIQDDFHSFFKKNRAMLCDTMRSIKKTNTDNTRVDVRLFYNLFRQDDLSWRVVLFEHCLNLGSYGCAVVAELLVEHLERS